MDIVAILGIMIPITALMIPIVALLTAHQRKMAEIIHQQRDNLQDNTSHRIDRIERSLEDLHDKLNALAINNDRPPIPDIRERIDQDHSA